MISTEIIFGNDIRDGNGGAENGVEDGVEGDNVVDLLDLDVVDCCVKQGNSCNGNRHVVPPKGPCPTERIFDDTRGNDGGS